jgi:hypothetical protein
MTAPKGDDASDSDTIDSGAAPDSIADACDICGTDLIIVIHESHELSGGPVKQRVALRARRLRAVITQ